jgi:hypothetical protein
MGQRPYFALASGVMGVKRLTSPPSGSRRMTERLPQGPFVIEEPDELRERVRALAEQLTTYADAR